MSQRHHSTLLEQVQQGGETTVSVAEWLDRRFKQLRSGVRNPAKHRCQSRRQSLKQLVISRESNSSRLMLVFRVTSCLFIRFLQFPCVRVLSHPRVRAYTILRLQCRLGKRDLAQSKIKCQKSVARSGPGISSHMFLALVIRLCPSPRTLAPYVGSP